jgi:DNA ligase-1
MAKVFRPMLADPADFASLRFPLLTSFKIDGIRATIHGGVAMSRSMKPLPNAYLQSWVRQMDRDLDGLDGEFIVGEPTAKDALRVTTSHLMSDSKSGFGFQFYVFDKHDMQGVTYRDRLAYLGRLVGRGIGMGDRVANLLKQHPVATMADLDAYEAEALALGFEGLMTRDPGGYYKQGRSTANGQELNKVKRAADMEAVVIGFDELEHNGNEGYVNEIGRTARSTAKAGKVGLGVLGALRVRGLPGSAYPGVEFSVGGGFDAAARERLWLNRDLLPGMIAKVKHFPLGAKDKPRHPIWLGWRDQRDLG